MSAPADGRASRAPRPLFRWAARVTLLLAMGALAIATLPEKMPLGWSSEGALHVRGLTLPSEARILVLSPHPDDDVLGCGGLIVAARRHGTPVEVVYLTNGDANEWSFLRHAHHPALTPRAVLRMGDVRRDEAISGESALGVGRENLIFLGYPDFGCMHILESHWRDAPPYTALFTRASAVPYPYAQTPGAPYNAASVLADLSRVLETFRPTDIFVSHPCDLNGDHRALFVFTQAAVWHSREHPRLHSFPVHADGWPRPPGLHDALLQMVPPPLQEPGVWESAPLDLAQVSAKRAALDAHRTQLSYSADYLHSFVRRNEIFDGTEALRLTPESPLGFGAQSAGIAGQEWRYVRLKEECIELSMVYSRPVARETRAVVRMFADRDDRAFAACPKITVTVDPLGAHLEDGTSRAPAAQVRITRDHRRTTVAVPLALLGDPQRLLISAESSLGESRLDRADWTSLTLSR
ncbi:MAG: hypothetical protein EB084_19040 [Proteobacteria bacterium]|nr:hypothetical protein [Pseudomonadota bacterium]